MSLNRTNYLQIFFQESISNDPSRVFCQLYCKFNQINLLAMLTLVGMLQFWNCTLIYLEARFTQIRSDLISTSKLNRKKYFDTLLAVPDLVPHALNTRSCFPCTKSIRKYIPNTLSFFLSYLRYFNFTFFKRFLVLKVCVVSLIPQKPFLSKRFIHRSFYHFRLN